MGESEKFGGATSERLANTLPKPTKNAASIETVRNAREPEEKAENASAA